MVFSSLATDLSANSARVSACVVETDLRVSQTLKVRYGSCELCKFSQPAAPDKALWNFTSFSLSVRTLISSSYLSSFWEYCGTKRMTRCHTRGRGVKLQSAFETLVHTFIQVLWCKTEAKTFSSPGSSAGGLTACTRPERSRLPSQPGPPVTSGCWSQFSTLPQAQSICWCFRWWDQVAKEEKKKGGRGGKRGRREPEVDTTTGRRRGERKQNE